MIWVSNMLGIDMVVDVRCLLDGIGFLVVSVCIYCSGLKLIGCIIISLLVIGLSNSFVLLINVVNLVFILVVDISFLRVFS